MASEHARADQLESGVRIGDFEIEKRLGAGGMGIVYLARQISLNRRVALKVLGPALTQHTGIARFQREAQAIARLKHPNIATLYFIGQDAELCYHVMEFIEGIPLRQVIERLAETQDVSSGPDTVVSAEVTPVPNAPSVRFDQPTTDDVNSSPPPEVDPLSAAAKQVRRNPQFVRRCCQIVMDAVIALGYAHKEGVVHRDVKPENLMLDPQGQVHVIDFGLARFFDDVSITNTGQLVGTPLYMSPEQVTGRIKVDHRTDIYSLGMVLYELLTLRRPIDFTSRENLLRNIVTKALPPLTARNRSLPKALEAIVHKATHKDPEERYQTAAEMAADLQRFLNDKPVVAPLYRYRLDLRETIGNRPGAVVLSAFFCFLMGTGFFTILLAISLMTAAIMNFDGPNLLVCLVQILIAVLFFAGFLFLGCGLLAGWNWVRWGVAVLAGLLALASLLGSGALLFTFLFSALTSNPAAAPGPTTQNFMVGMALMYAVPLLLIAVISITSVVALLLPSTGEWFRMAGQARREHRALLKSLGD